MGRSESYRKNIDCLESFWTSDVENRLSVQPVVELAAKENYVKAVLLTSNTVEELEYNLKIAPNRNGYRVLYFAFHGVPGGILVPGSFIDLEAMADFMGKRFSNWIVHFGSCATLRTEKSRIINFMEKTRVLMVVGYKKRTNWMDGAAIDLLLLDWLQAYKDMRKFWTRFRNTYRDLIRETGLDAFHRTGIQRRFNRLDRKSKGKGGKSWTRKRKKK
jgi:hypothetical protein